MLDLTRDARRHIGDGRDPKDPHAHVPRDQDFRNGAHPDCVSAETAHHAQFRRCLVVRPGHRDVHTFAQIAVDLVRELAQLLGVRADHVHEARAEPVVVRTAKRVDAHEIDVVVDHHEIAGLERRIQSATGVRDDHRPHAPGAEHPHGEADGRDVVALVVVNPPVHDRDVPPRYRSDDELARVTRCGALLETGEIAVGDPRAVGDLARERA